MESIQYSNTLDFTTFFHGHLLADKPKKRAASITLAVIAGFLLYAGLQKEPMDENMTYGGLLTILYIFVGRGFMFKLKIRSLWKKETPAEQAFKLDEKGLEWKNGGEESSSFEWSTLR